MKCLKLSGSIGGWFLSTELVVILCHLVVVAAVTSTLNITCVSSGSGATVVLMTLGGSAIAVSGGAESGLGTAGGVGDPSDVGSTAIGAWGDVTLTVFFASCLVGVS